MAHRHTVQKRARGGGVRGGEKIDHNYAAPGADRIEKEARSQTEDFATGGGVQLAKAHGGGIKKRGDRRARGGALTRAEGGSVWSHAASKLRGKKGFAGAPTGETKNSHGELHKDKVGDTEKKAFRHSHTGKAAHQYAAGGKVKGKGFAKGGKADPVDMNPEHTSGDEWESKHAKGGRTGKKHGGECDDDMD